MCPMSYVVQIMEQWIDTTTRHTASTKRGDDKDHVSAHRLGRSSGGSQRPDRGSHARPAAACCLLLADDSPSAGGSWCQSFAAAALMPRNMKTISRCSNCCWLEAWSCHCTTV